MLLLVRVLFLVDRYCEQLRVVVSTAFLSLIYIPAFMTLYIHTLVVVLLYCFSYNPYMAFTRFLDGIDEADGRDIDICF